MQRELKELPRCYVCDVPLGESNNTLYVDGQWLHYSCAFNLSVSQAMREKKDNKENN